MRLVSKSGSPEKQAPQVFMESRAEALGRFLRERREALAPRDAGISSRRGRRTPGLRREEVAFLADIGAKWYARLEAGHDVRPSAATLTGIAMALRLSNAELDYMLDLAGLRQSPVGNADTSTVPEPLAVLIGSLRGVAATLGDRILTPLIWNDLADALYGHSGYPNPVKRNALVRSLVDPRFIAFLGAEREQLVTHAVGMFRLNYSSRSPSRFAADVYDVIKDEPLFQQAWHQRVVASELTGTRVTVREHAVVGRLTLYAVDLTSGMESGFLIRVMIPADEESAKKFSQLEEIASRTPAPSISPAVLLRA